MSKPITSKLKARDVINAIKIKRSLAKEDIDHQFQMYPDNYAKMGPKTRRRVIKYANSIGWRYFYSPNNKTHVWYDPKKITSLKPESDG